MELNKIIGLKVVAIRGVTNKKVSKNAIEPHYILFSDKKTYILLKEQDYYSYHDCNSCARIIVVYFDKENWKNIFEDTISFPEAEECWNKYYACNE